MTVVADSADAASMAGAPSVPGGPGMPTRTICLGDKKSCDGAVAAAAQIGRTQECAPTPPIR